MSKCIPFPAGQKIDSLAIDYSGQGTPVEDVVMVVGGLGIVALAIVTIVVMSCMYYSRSGLFRNR